MRKKWKSRCFYLSLKLRHFPSSKKDAGKALQQNIFNHIEFLKKKQKDLEVKFQLFQEAEGMVWQEMKKGIDALLVDMMYSIDKVHTELIEVTH
jgi:protoporphyrinogen oxidase